MNPAVHDSAAAALVLDGCAFLAGALAAFAAAQAEQAFVEVRALAAGGDRTPEELAALIEARGAALVDLWADLMARTGQDREDWARETALRAVRAYAGRLGELLATAVEGGRG